jgi:hypothetical protein
MCVLPIEKRNETVLIVSAVVKIKHQFNYMQLIQVLIFQYKVQWCMKEGIVLLNVITYASQAFVFCEDEGTTNL